MSEVAILVQHGPYMVDERTGEIVGLAPELARFAVTDRDSAEWVLERISEAESEVAALDARLAIFMANVESMKADHERRAAWLRTRFGPELQAWARSELEGQKTRTVKTPFGRMSFRKVAARIVVHDEAKAIEWAESIGADECVKVTKKFLVSSLGDAVVPPGCDLEPERESFSVKTGVEK